MLNQIVAKAKRYRRVASELVDRALASRFTPDGLGTFVDRTRQSPMARRLAHGAFWSVAGGVGSRGLILISSIVLARMMGRETFGELGIIQSTVGMFGTLAGFGLGVTATKFVAELREKEPLRAARILALSRLFSILASGGGAFALALAAPWLAASSLAAPHLAGPLRVSSLLLFLSGVSGAQLGAMAGLLAFRSIAMVNVGYAAFSLPLTVLGAKYWGLDGVVWALNAGMLAACLLGRRALRRACSRAGLPWRPRGWHHEAAVLWRFSLPAVLSAALVGPVNWACAAILVNQDRGYAEMGVFNAANQWYSGLIFFPSLLGQAALPLLSERAGQGASASSMHLMRRLIGLNAGVALPLALVCLLSPMIMSLYGAGFNGRWSVLVISAVTAALLALQAPVGQYIVASGRLWAGLLMNLGWAAVFLLASSILAVRWGADGLAMARLAAYVAHGFWTFGFAVKWARARE